MTITDKDDVYNARVGDSYKLFVFNCLLLLRLWMFFQQRYIGLSTLLSFNRVGKNYLPDCSEHLLLTELPLDKSAL